MRHEEKVEKIKHKNETLYIKYSDTYHKPIAEVVEPYGVKYIALSEAYEDAMSKKSYYCPLSEYMSRNYRAIKASDGLFFIPAGSKLSKPSEYKPKKYAIATGNVLASDVLGQDIRGGSIVYYSYIQYRSLYSGFFFVRNITDGHGQLVCHAWNRSTKQFETVTRNISNISECIVVDKEKFLKKFEIEGFFVPEEY